MNDTAASDLDPQWREAFVLELRARDVPGAAIGAALADVEAHCHDSNLSAVQAFGDPAAYARDLAVPQEPLTRRALTPVMLRGIGGVVGMLVGLKGFSAYLGSGIVLLTTGDLAVLALVLTALGLLWVFAGRIVTAIVRGGRRAILLGGVVGAALAAAVIGLRTSLDDVLWLVPAGLLFGLGTGLLIVVTVNGLSRPPITDPITGPLDSAKNPRTSALWSRLGACSYLIATLILGGLIWVLRVL